MHTVAIFTSMYIYQKLTNKSESPTKFEEDKTTKKNKMNQQHQNNRKVKNESHPIKNQNHMDNNGHKNYFLNSGI